MPAHAPGLLITCEHGGNRVPAQYAALFAGQQALLESHRGLDIGSLVIARQIAHRLEAPLVEATVTRLLVDLNRSPGRGRRYSEITRGLPAAAREALVQHYWAPYRGQVDASLARLLAQHGRVVHVSVHTFAAVLDGVRRTADIGLLYDPRREPERMFCQHWQQALRHSAPAFSVRRNYPYLGRADGLTTALRRRHPPSTYIGIELEINQAITAQPEAAWAGLRQQLADSLAAALVAAPAQVWQTPG
ncbi:MAG: N-formylglutamate amidohydrolase [Gammaproteobacteria bacterium]|nr:N-formylglutamate amidohydrolase [Gammaproteobacteria bacterium]